MADMVEMVVSVLQVSSVLWKRIHLLSHSGEFTMTQWGGFHTLLGNSFKRVCERKTVMMYQELRSTENFVSRILFGCFHVGRYCPPSRQALKALVCVIDEDPVFVLVVSLRVITGSCWLKNIRFWKLIEV